MKLVAIVFWLHHRHQLRAKGYSLGNFCEMNDTYWAGLATQIAPKTKNQSEPAQTALARQQLRARW